MIIIKRNSFSTLEDARNWIGDLEHIVTLKETVDSHWYEVSVFIKK